MRCVNDGASWIWKLVADRWAGAEQGLDFYHASQHLWALGEALHGADEAAVRAWVEPRRRVRREQNYLAAHAPRLRYRELAARGPIGSGAVESACRQRQCRFKRAGQFWTATGLRHLCALQEARHNRHWEELWTVPPAHGA